MAGPAGISSDIVAAVMTYNRRESLRRCLQAIRGQTLVPKKVLVIDNASTDGTDKMLSEEFPDVAAARTQENLGCAGAMHEALRHALNLRPEYIWLFDDDAIAAPTCLEILYREIQILQQERRVGILRSMMQDPVTGDVRGGGMSCGGLLRGEMVATVTYPYANLFIELSDYSYERAVRRAGYEILRVPIVLVHHPVDQLRSLQSIIANGYRVKPWRLYYQIRNEIYFNLYVERSLPQLLRHLAITGRTIALLTMFGRPRRGYTFLFRGVVDGLLARLGRRVDPDY